MPPNKTVPPSKIVPPNKARLKYSKVTLGQISMVTGLYTVVIALAMYYKLLILVLGLGAALVYAWVNSLCSRGIDWNSWHLTNKYS